MYGAGHPLALALDIDQIRHGLGRWRDRAVEAGLAARAIAVAAAQTHLAAGYDVVVPQLAAQEALLDQFAETAAQCDATFLEFVADVDRDQSLRRYTERWQAGHDLVHAAAEPPDLEDIGRTYDQMVAFAATRTEAVRLPAGSSTAMYRAMLSALENMAR